MALITPTTTMMREGVTQAATKIDTGFFGDLNWGLRNGSHKDLMLGHGEPKFKLTLFALGVDESPEVAYGEREVDTYQSTEGIRRSTRRIPADIPKQSVIASSIQKLDPKKALKEAGYPFNHVSTELTELDGTWEVVSSDVRLMKQTFEQQTNALGGKIDGQMEKVERLFDKKFGRLVGVIVGGASIMYGIVQFMQDASIPGNVIGALCIGAGILIAVLLWCLSKSGVI